MQAEHGAFEYDRGWLTANVDGSAVISATRWAADGHHAAGRAAPRRLYCGAGICTGTALDGLTVSSMSATACTVEWPQGSLRRAAATTTDGLLSWQRGLAPGSALFFRPAPGAAGRIDVEGLLLEQPRRGGRD